MYRQAASGFGTPPAMRHEEDILRESIVNCVDAEQQEASEQRHVQVSHLLLGPVSLFTFIFLFECFFQSVGHDSLLMLPVEHDRSRASI